MGLSIEFKVGSFTDSFRDRLYKLMREESGATLKEAQDAAPRKSVPAGRSDGSEPKKTLADSLRTDGAIDAGKQIYYEIIVDLASSPDALAWEFGSGLHSPKEPGKYVIAGRNRDDQMLIFFWEKMQKMFKGPFVNHPGIAARPYLRPAIHNSIQRMRQKLSG